MHLPIHSRTRGQAPDAAARQRLAARQRHPSIETWLRCQRRQVNVQPQTGLLRLPRGSAARPNGPPVRVVDMRLEWADGHRR